MTNNSIPAPRRAEKRKVKLKVAIQGPSGSGKTWGALALAKNLWPDAKVLVVDTENESASLYADKFEFDTIPLSPPFHSARYEACIDAAVSGGYEVLVIDSITHQWDGDGGILRRKEELDQRPGSNSYTNWSKFTPEHTAFIESIKQAPIHIIATMRSKQDYVLEANANGKQTPRKVGLAPIQRDGFNYEFSLVFDVQMDHKAVVDKNRTGLFGDSLVNLADKKTAKAIREWLDAGKEAPTVETTVKPTPTAAVEQAAVPAPQEVHGFIEQAKRNKKGELALQVGMDVILVDASYPGAGELEASTGKIGGFSCTAEGEVHGKKIYRMVDFVGFVEKTA